jgi:hypothetical protein
VRIIKGDPSAPVDGEDCQFWDWTNRDVARVLAEMTGHEEFVVGRTGGHDFCLLTHDGHREHRERRDGEPLWSWENAKRTPLWGSSAHPRPEDRFNSRASHGGFEKKEGLPECRLEFDSKYLDTRAMTQLSETYQNALGRDELKRERKRELQQERRRKVLSNCFGVIVTIVVLIGMWYAFTQ